LRGGVECKGVVDAVAAHWERAIEIAIGRADPSRVADFACERICDPITAYSKRAVDVACSRTVRAFVALFTSCLVDLEVTAHTLRAIGIAIQGFACVIACFVVDGVDVAIAADLVGQAVLATTVTRDFVAVVAHLPLISPAVATGLESAIRCAAITQGIVAIIATLADVLLAITAALVGLTIGPAAIPGRIVAVIANLTLIVVTVAAPQAFGAIEVAVVIVTNISIIAHFPGFDLAVTTGARDACVTLRRALRSDDAPQTATAYHRSRIEVTAAAYHG
jgi:hypothetical protein